MSVAGSEGIITPGGLPESAFPRVLGIDPGITGGLALFVAGSGTIDARDIPTADGEVDIGTLTAILREWSPTVAYVERARAMQAVVRLRAMDKRERRELESIIELYKQALGMD